MNEPKPDSTAAAEITVGPGDLACALPLAENDAFPDVLATARMVALIEIAAARLLQPCLCAGQLSVGVSIELTHAAPTPPGARVTARARYLGRDDKFFEFNVVVSDAGGEVGRARHKRAIVDAERLQDKAASRILAAKNASSAQLS